MTPNLPPTPPPRPEHLNIAKKKTVTVNLNEELPSFDEPEIEHADPLSAPQTTPKRPRLQPLTFKLHASTPANPSRNHHLLPEIGSTLKPSLKLTVKKKTIKPENLVKLKVFSEHLPYGLSRNPKQFKSF
jgi:hypothetical protein